MIDRLNATLADRYEIQQQLGEGGMATVYLARDVKHSRQVALKVLRPELAAVVGAERFLAEIETTANLQHPHILPLFDSGEAEGILFYVMPYVEGESLRERIQKEHQLPVEKALEITENVAAALQYAHEQGVVHRDVKPANILLSRGKPLVADFGIALALSEAGGGRITETGLSLGTPHYMSPEQAAGERSLDKRTDVYALGCVLYEMLTGQPPYGGPTAQAVLGRILTGDPTPPTEHRKAIPANVEHAVLKALKKLPADRFESADEFVRALKNPSFRHGTGVGAGPGAPEAQVGRWKQIAFAAIAVATVLAGFQLWSVASTGTAAGVERQRIELGSAIEELPGVLSFGVRFAPDGSGILFPDTTGVGSEQGPSYWWKAHDETDPVRIPNMDGARVPVFSPDGRWVAYLAENQLRKQPLRGGTTVLLADSVDGIGIEALAWLSDGSLLVENDGPVIERISEDGSQRDTVATIEEVAFPVHASGLSGSAALVSSCTDQTCSQSRLFLLDLEADMAVALADGVLRAWPAPASDDRIVYVDRRGGVFAASLDRNELRLEPPVPLFDGVATSDRTAEMELGDDGSLIYVRGESGSFTFSVVQVNRAGQAEAVDPEWEPDEFLNLALSPDGTRLATEIVTEGTRQIWVKELPDGPLTRLTVGPGEARRPAWIHSGRSVAYIAQDSAGPWHIRALRSDGSSTRPDTLLQLDRDLFEVVWSGEPGGILFRAGNTGDDAADVGLAHLRGDTTITWLLDSGFNENAPALSPDGRWLAYVSDRSGQNEVYVRPFPDVGGRRIQVSVDGGTEPLWAHSGEELFYKDRGGWMTAASVVTAPAFEVRDRERLFVTRFYRPNASYRVYDVSPDDESFVMIGTRQLGESRDTDLILVRNWIQELNEALDR